MRFFAATMLIVLTSSSFVCAEEAGTVSFADYNAVQDAVFRRDYIPQQDIKDRLFRISPDKEVLEALMPETRREPAPAPEKEAIEEKPKKEDLVRFLFSRTHPYASTELAYDDNIYVVQFNKKDDRVSTTTAGGKFIFSSRPLSSDSVASAKNNTIVLFDVGGVVRQYFFSGDGWQVPYASVDVITGKGPWRFKFRNFFKTDFTPDSFLSTDSGRFVSYLYNETSAVAEFKYKRAGLQLMWTRTAYMMKNPDRQGNTNQVNGFSITGLYRPRSWRKTDLLAEYDFGKAEYPKSVASLNNYTYQLVWVGVKGRLTKKTTAVIKGGFQTRNYEEAKDSQNFPIAVYVTHAYSPKTSFSVAAFSAGELSPNNAIGVYTENRVDVGCRHKFTPHVTLNLDAYAKQNLNREPKSMDTGHGFAGTLSWALRRWMEVALDYRYDLLDAGGSRATGYKHTVYAVRTKIWF